MRKLIVGLVTALCVGVFSSPAQATSITGGIAFTGDVDLIGGSGFDTATELDFSSEKVLSGTGSYSTVPAGSLAPFSNLKYDPFASVTPLWTFTSGGLTYSFNLTSLTIVLRTAQFLALSGTGTLKITGFADTPGKFSLSANTTDLANFGFASTSSAVPEYGSTMLLVGFGVLAVGLLQRKMLL